MGCEFVRYDLSISRSGIQYVFSNFMTRSIEEKAKLGDPITDFEEAGLSDRLIRAIRHNVQISLPWDEPLIRGHLRVFISYPALISGLSLRHENDINPE